MLVTIYKKIILWIKGYRLLAEDRLCFQHLEEDDALRVLSFF